MEDVQRGTLVLVFERTRGDVEEDFLGIVQEATPDPGTWIVFVDGEFRTIHLSEMMPLCVVKDNYLMKSPDLVFRRNLIPAFKAIARRIRETERSILLPVG